MAGDWAYDELLPIAAVELTILGLAVALCVNRRSHLLVSTTRARAPGPVCTCLPSTSPPTAARHPFPDHELPELYRFWVKRRRLQRLPYADAISKVGSCSPFLNETERAIKHFCAAASCRRRATSSSEPTDWSAECPLYPPKRTWISTAVVGYNIVPVPVYFAISS